jgi:Uma2 family endonuclease
MPGPSINHGRVITKLSRYIDVYVEGKQLGSTLSGTAFVFDVLRNTARVPDVAFVAEERLVNIDFNGAFPGVPDLAIEVISPSDIWSEVVDKVSYYLQREVRLVWVVDPFDKNVYVYRAGQPKKTLLLHDTLSGEDVIPGFEVAVSKLFE